MFSIIMPMDTDRLKQFAITKRIYDGYMQPREFIIPTRNYKELKAHLKKEALLEDVRLIPYEHNEGFNPSKAFNIGVNKARYDNIVITCPEVRPLTSVFDQLEQHLGENIICQVFDEDEEGKRSVLVNTIFRADSPAMYFLAMFNKADIQKVNGWDEEFMKGYAYEDNDFGERWKRAGLPFIVRDDIQALHQYHPRGETIKNGTNINYHRYQQNNNDAIVRCAKGLEVLN